MRKKRLPSGKRTVASELLVAVVNERLARIAAARPWGIRLRSGTWAHGWHRSHCRFAITRTHSNWCGGADAQVLEGRGLRPSASTDRGAGLHQPDFTTCGQGNTLATWSTKS